MEEQNPEKIPLNPINEPVADRQLFENPETKQDVSQQILSGLHRQKTSQPTMALKYKIFLAVIMIIFFLVVAAIGKVLFRNGLV